MIIDDDRELTGLLTEFFAGASVQLVSVPDGARGLAQALDGGFDLVILDVMLPGVDGFEVLRQLRKQSIVPVIMLTAWESAKIGLLGCARGRGVSHQGGEVPVLVCTTGQ